MTTRDQLGDFISGLSADLKPVRRLSPPSLRTLGWLSGVVLVAAAVYLWLGGQANSALFADRPYAVLSLLGSALTAILAAAAAFQLSLPDRNDAWVFLPAPALILWVTASGVGCLAGLGSADTWGDSFAESRQCLSVILGVSIPVSVLLIVMLRKAAPLRWGSVAVMAGLASAAAAGSVLLLVHPHDSTVLDLAVHALCIALVVAVSALVGGRLFKFS